MTTPNPWIYFAITIWIAVAIWAYTKYKQVPALSKQELESNGGEKETFPSFFWHIHTVLWTLWPIASFAIMFPLIEILPRSQGLYTSPEVITFSSPDTYFLACSLAVGLAMVSFPVIGKKVFSYFPQFDKYQALRNKLASKSFGKLKWRTQQKKIEETTTIYNEEKLAQIEWRKILAPFLFVWLTAAPLLILSIDTYVLTTKDSVYVNRFFKLTADSVPLSSAKSAKMHFNTSSNCYGRGGCSESHLVPHLDIYFSNGATYDVWGSLGRDFNKQENLIQVIRNIKALNVPISVIPMDAREIATLPRYDDNKRGQIEQIIEEAQTP